ncbi:hypothetical protein B0H21DRAFT_721224 [Amylocystis lapponica]|nr:hypothetical protein B0H21DRAFT_721224 [Amylocystis lapponica]
MSAQDQTSKAPPEIWHIIFGCLPDPDKRRCLTVSTLFHDFALPFVFRTLHIYFGSWQRLTTRQTNRGSEPDASLRVAEEAQVARTREVLQHIAGNDTFAAVVKKVVVYAYATEDATTEQNLLVQAVPSLVNLRAFTWHGSLPEPSKDVVEALASSCPHLDEVSFSRSLTSWPGLYALQNLRSIAFTWDQVGSNVVEASQDLTEYSSLIEANTNSLQELSTFGAVPWTSVMPALQNLTCLEIHAMSSLTGIAVLFHVCPQLESLTLEPDFDELKHLFAAFVIGPTLLPNLSSFKWISPNLRLSEPILAYVADFLRPKKKLRRLDLDLHCTLEILPLLLSVVQELGTVEVLGMDLQTQDGPLSPEDAATVAQYLPPGLTALRLHTSVEEPSEDFGLWTNHLSKFPALRFVDVQDWSCPLVTLDEVLANPGEVELLGLNGQVRQIEKVGDRAEASLPWSKHKVVFRTAEDLGGEDREWLMRHHDMTMSLHNLVFGLLDDSDFDI